MQETGTTAVAPSQEGFTVTTSITTTSSSSHQHQQQQQLSLTDPISQQPLAHQQQQKLQIDQLKTIPCKYAIVYFNDCYAHSKL